MGKAGYIFVGVILPVICFLLVSSGSLPNVDWQSGRLADYCTLLFSMDSRLPFYPFLLFSMTCMTLMVIKPEFLLATVYGPFGNLYWSSTRYTLLCALGLSVSRSALLYRFYSNPITCNCIMALCVFGFLDLFRPWTESLVIHSIYPGSFRGSHSRICFYPTFMFCDSTNLRYNLGSAHLFDDELASCATQWSGALAVQLGTAFRVCILVGGVLECLADVG